MSSPGQSFFRLESGLRKTALLPIAEDRFIALGMSAGCEKFVGRYARIDAFRVGDGMIRFRVSMD